MRRFLSLFVATVMMASAAFALELADAKNQGLVGEKPDGYLGVVGTPTPAVSALVNDINSRRKEEYQKIAGKNAQELNVVEKLAGAKAIEKTRVGNYVFSGGKWVKK